MDDCQIDVVLVTYNRVQLLKECIDALLKQKNNISEIFVIDNHSTDGTSEYLKGMQTNKKINPETLDSNVGGAAGFEYGVKKSTEQGKGRYIWIMDDDTIPNSMASFALLKKADDLKRKFGFLCSNVRWTDGSPTNIAHVASDWPSKINEGIVKVEAATFVSVLVPKNNVVKLGCPIGAMQIWGDDTEFTTRMSSYADSYFVDESIVIHKTTHNLMTDTLKNIDSSRIGRFKAEYRNLIYIQRRYKNKKNLFKTTLSNIVTGFGALRAPNHKFKRLFAALSGTIEGYLFRPEIKMPKSSFIQKKRKNEKNIR